MRESIRFEYINWSEFYRLSVKIFESISASGYRPDTIVAIARGGYAPARILADYFGVMDLISLKIEHYHGPDKMPRAVVPYPLVRDISGRTVLLVDDVSDSGETFRVALDHLAGCGVPASLRTAVLHYKTTAALAPAYYAKRIIKWRWVTYPWAVVEDLSVVASRIRPAPKDVSELKRKLKECAGIVLPERLFSQVAVVVLSNVAAVG